MEVTNMVDKWAYPKAVTDVEIAFGGNMEELLPPAEVIPEEFWKGETKWNKLAEAIFYGRKTNFVIHERENIDVHFAARHIRAILASFEPKHEHKMAGCAYLLSRFYADVTPE
jgi:hypothetical protein